MAASFCAFSRAGPLNDFLAFSIQPLAFPPSAFSIFLLGALPVFGQQPCLEVQEGGGAAGVEVAVLPGEAGAEGGFGLELLLGVEEEVEGAPENVVRRGAGEGAFDLGAAGGIQA